MSNAALPGTRSLLAITLAILAAGAGTAAPIRQELSPAAPPPPAASDASQPDDAPVRVDPALVKAGAERYNLYCQRCHGLNMVNQGGGTFDLRTFPLYDKARFVQSVTQGKRTMPAWGGVLKTEDLEALWNYIANHQVGKTASR